MLFEAQIGGYYTYKNKDGGWSIFRMLDFADNAIHCALYRETFDHKPNLEEAKSARPFVLHAPVHKATLFSDEDLTLLGAKPVEASDLEGMVTYMQQTSYTAEQMEYVVRRIGGLQKDGKVTMKLIKVGDTVKIAGGQE